MPDTVTLKHATIHFNEDGTPVADAFDDVYFSNDNGLHESQYVFLANNGLPERWQHHPYLQFTIFETGFGTGLNFLLSWLRFIEFKQANPASPLKLHFVTFEKFPLEKDDLKQALTAWPELSELAVQLIEQYPPALPGCHRLLFEHVTLDIWLGDVNGCLPTLISPESGIADAWFLDGFAPSKNPDMWQDGLFKQMGRLARNGCTVASFTAAGFVRRGLIGAGFAMKKVPGFGKKREMIAGQLAHPKPEPACPPQQVAIIGAGLAGSHLAFSFARRGIHIALFDTHPNAGMAASGNRQGALYPLLNGNHDTLSQFYGQAFGLSRQVVELQAKQTSSPLPYQWCGVLHYSFDEKHQKKHQQLMEANFPPQLVKGVTQEEAEALSGIHTEHSGVFYPQGGWVNPPQLCQALVEYAVAPNAQHFGQQVTVHPAGHDHWHVTTGEATMQFSHVVFASGAQSSNITHLHHLPLQAVRGQVSHLPASQASSALRTLVCHSGYATPQWQGQHCIGATFDRNRTDTELDLADHTENLQRFATNLTDALFTDTANHPMQGRVGFRSRVRDHLPLVGPLGTPEQDGLFMLGALGARGLCSAALCAELLASQLCSEPLPVNKQLANALAADRFERKKQ